MSKKTKQGRKKIISPKHQSAGKRKEINAASIWPWALLVAGITACFLGPMLRNDFTNWDDEYYVIQNALLRGPDWKGIFTTPVVSNYHPITILTLAFNYAVSELNATSYLLVNLLFHLANTVLVYYFIYQISGKKTIVAAFTSLVFGIHPMHVESVAWVSERKDVLYAFFFLLSLIQYWQYLQTELKRKLFFSLLFFVLSVLSKPAAIILPLMLLLLDYWKGCAFSRKMITVKIPFFIVSLIMAVVTVKIQSKTAITGLDLYPVWMRFLFATYTGMIYLVRFIIPYPLSAFHPFPSVDSPGLVLLLSPLFILALLVLVWLKRNNKLIVFSLLFYFINILLVMQVITVGAALVAERYTYIPYIGVTFLVAMLLEQYVFSSGKKWIWQPVFAGCLVFGLLSFQRTKVWKDSETLWTDVLKYYPNAHVARNNRANDLIKKSLKPEWKQRENEILLRALEDCNVSIKNKPEHPKAYENRQNIYLRLKRDSLAFADATKLLQLEPYNAYGYYTKGFFFFRSNRPDSSLYYFNKCLELRPNTDYALHNRGCLLFNNYKQYKEALADISKAIKLNPSGEYFLNRSRCYYQLGDLLNARADVETARQKGYPAPDDLKTLLQLK